jgi:hypothetical protein
MMILPWNSMQFTWVTELFFLLFNNFFYIRFQFLDHFLSCDFFLEYVPLLRVISTFFLLLNPFYHIRVLIIQKHFISLFFNIDLNSFILFLDLTNLFCLRNSRWRLLLSKWWLPIRNWDINLKGFLFSCSAETVREFRLILFPEKVLWFGNFLHKCKIN